MFSKGRSNEEYGRVSDMDILSYYFGIDKLPTKINSPLREDKKPSFGMYTRDGESVYFIDFATGDRGSIVKLMSLIWNMDMNETIDRIRHEIGKKEHMHIPIIKLSGSSKAYTRSGVEIRRTI